MPPKVYIACVETYAAQMPEVFRASRTAIIEEHPVRYRQPRDRLLHQLGLRMAAAQLSPAEATHLTVVRGRYGKPYFKEFPHFAFNISHSGSYVVCAVHEHPVGVDLQEQTLLERDSWHLFLSPQEAEVCPDSDQALLLWSAKEAVSKYTGNGFMRPLPELGILPKRNPNPLFIGKEHLFLWQWRFRCQYILTICTPSEQPPQIEHFSVERYLNRHVKNGTVRKEIP